MLLLTSPNSTTKNTVLAAVHNTNCKQLCQHSGKLRVGCLICKSMLKGCVMINAACNSYQHCFKMHSQTANQHAEAWIANLTATTQASHPLITFCKP